MSDAARDPEAPTFDPEAPWGRKVNGEPKKRPGNAPGSNGGGGRKPALSRPVIYPGMPVLLLTEEVAEAIVTALLAGRTIKAAAFLAGVKPATVNDWLRKGEEGEGPEPFASFAFACGQAIAVAGGNLLDPIWRSAVEGNTNDAKWLLQNTPHHRDEWGEQPKEKGNTSGALLVQLVFPDARSIEAGAHGALESGEVTEAEIVGGD